MSDDPAPHRCLFPPPYGTPGEEWVCPVCWRAWVADDATDTDETDAVGMVWVEWVPIGPPTGDGIDRAWEDDYRNHSSSHTGLYEAP